VLTTAVELGFAVAAVIAVVSLAAALVDRVGRSAVIALAVVLAAAATAAWVAFALHERAAIAVAAAGISVCFAAELAALRIGRLAASIRAVDEEFADAETRLSVLIAGEASARTAELERTLARARADSSSLLAEQERRLAEERRRIAEERTATSRAELLDQLAKAQQQVDARLQTWVEDLDRQQRAVADRLEQLAARQRQLIFEAEARIAADAERLESESEQQRQGLMRLRDELARAIEEAVTAGNAELDTYASERRRAMHELNERLRRRERALSEQVEREGGEATRRIQTAFTDVERRQVEQLQRVLDRAATSYSDVAAQQFSDSIRTAREEAATRLARELDRAVQSFAREAERVLAERLSQVGNAGAQRLEKRMSQVTEGLERQRSEAIAAFEERLMSAEQDLRRRLEGVAADAEAERAVLDARLHDLARRIDEVIARA
jgi:hypothetical protein